jgi:hypothetical protein
LSLLDPRIRKGILESVQVPSRVERFAPGFAPVLAWLEDGLRENPSFIAFARDNGTVYHTYTVLGPDPFVAPYHSFLLARTPKPELEEPRAWRKDEYPDRTRQSSSVSPPRRLKEGK